MSLLALVAGTLGVSQAVATTVVSIVLTGSTLVSIILGITAILSGGVDAILEIGWSTFVATVKKNCYGTGQGRSNCLVSGEAGWEWPSCFSPVHVELEG